MGTLDGGIVIWGLDQCCCCSGPPPSPPPPPTIYVVDPSFRFARLVIDAQLEGWRGREREGGKGVGGGDVDLTRQRLGERRERRRREEEGGDGRAPVGPSTYSPLLGAYRRANKTVLSAGKMLDEAPRRSA